MNTIQEVNFSIMQGEFTNEQLDSISSAVQFRRAQISKSTKRALTIGSKVKFTSNRNGVTYTGTVEKIKIKFILVHTGTSRFNVPANMLTVA